jgi:multicomponent Na+:H+ antiporter subunit E
MNLMVLAGVLALMWAAITGQFTLENLLLGLAIGILALVLLRGQVARPRALRQLRRGFMLFAVFLREMVLSAVRVALVVIDPKMKEKLRPAFVAVPLDLETDGQITLLANMVTLTPGTLSVDVSEDRSVLIVHVLTLKDRETLIAGIKTGFEARIKEVFDERE